MPLMEDPENRDIEPALWEALRSHPDEQVRDDVASLLTPILAKAMRHSCFNVRQRATSICSQLGVDRASVLVPDLILRLDDENNGVRQEALSKLKWLGPKAGAAVPKILELALTDPGKSIREKAGRVLFAIDRGWVWIWPVLGWDRARKSLAEKLLPSGEAGRALSDKVEALRADAAACEPQAVPGAEAEAGPFEATSGSDEAGRALSDKVEAWQPVAAACEPRADPDTGTEEEPSGTASGSGSASARMPRLRRRQGASRKKPKPHWDGERGELLYEGTRVKKVSIGKARNVVAVLAAFERAGWPFRIDDPTGKGQEAMHQTIRSLNKRLQGIRFRGDDTGKGISWEVR
jgi:hypothetical protein